jgi:hypothetical protein
VRKEFRPSAGWEALQQDVTEERRMSPANALLVEDAIFGFRSFTPFANEDHLRNSLKALLHNVGAFTRTLAQ